MPEYSLGKIYKIVGNGKVYVGSTTARLLCIRMAEHHRKYKQYINGTTVYVSSFDCIEDPDCYIELLESYPCNNRDELTKCEGKWIREIECVNHKVEGRTRNERRAEQKEYISKQQKAYNEQNKEKQTIQRKQKYERTKERLREKFICECGGKYAYADKKHHEKTIKHQSFLKSNLSIESEA
jgi:hypothetical protein